MEKDDQAIVESSVSEETSQQPEPIVPTSIQIYSPVRSVGRVLVKDWRTSRYVLFGLLLILLTILVVLAYYFNRPFAEPRVDTYSYLDVVKRIQTNGQLVNVWRLPGFPLLIVLVYALAGQGNMFAVGIVNAVLFVLTTLETYILAVLVIRRAWIAFLIGLLIGANVPLVSFVKPILTEAPSLWLLTSLTLAVVYFLYTLQVRILWLVTICTLLLFMTRAEWSYIPVPLFIYLLIIAAFRGRAGRLLPHALASVILLYAVLGGYVYINATRNGIAQVTAIENINALGKVLQYNMQDEAPPQYTSISRKIDPYVAKGIVDPYAILRHEPALARNSAAPAGKYAQSIIDHHIGEFLIKSVPVALFSLANFHAVSNVIPTGAYGTSLLKLESVFHALYRWNLLFPLCAAIWLFLLCLPRTRQLRTVQTMGAIVLLSLYGVIITTLGAYTAYDYTRIHTVFDPLLTLVCWGTLLLGALLIAERGPEVLVRLGSRYSADQWFSISRGTILIATVSGLAFCLFAIRLLLVHGTTNQIAVVFLFVTSVASLFHYLRLTKST